MRKLFHVSRPAALAMLAAFGTATTIDTYAQAQTAGMERRGDRRDTRQQARTDKHACNASGMASRSDCRQTKRGDKQEGRQDRMNGGPPNP